MSLERVLRNSKFIYFLKDVKQIPKKETIGVWDGLGMSLETGWGEVE